ncbi:hypothetical protein ABB37_06181 [Leptomonas pyrrhocoris]|uniref:Nrap protein domain-containing protein n=1 Tax=Leptomonas pyrrhocoris TaxID=157538 RepID=A0A0N0DUI2_LEPPY|nr:hypothetical protein ABB37_06181 [Leptomonas pyrrhocoris]KPA78581.1 hypothetical protein ABB37_06181 [Leptomonas pyrrhocoris]|eukprot:XP_015657020.1 hypothetical protein ABB37_06181 [Leptomonas pyrrhocoris]
MALQNYNLAWSDSLVERVETHLRDIHSALIQHYESSGYETDVEGRQAAADANGEDESAAAAATIDAVSPAGSFLLRTCVYDTPFPELHAQRGVGADLVLSIPASCCSAADLQDGLYLERRQAFLEEIHAYLAQLIRGATKRAAAATASSSTTAAAATADSDGDNESSDGEAVPSSRTKKTASSRRSETAKAANMAAAARLSRMEVSVAPIHGCYALEGKNILKLRFRRRAQPAVYETFFVNLHFRPSMFSGRTVNAAAVRKHPYYSYSILEDYLMPHYLKKLHEVCVASASVRRAIVVLKCWAHHTGLMSAASGHPEGLNGFVIAAMVLRLLEEGIVSASMSLDNMVRAVWVQLSRGFFASGSATAVARPVKVSLAEEQGEMCVLRFAGEVHNILFHTSTAFFQHVIRPAAEEALQHPFSMEVVDRVAFLPLPLRYDVALTVRLHASANSSSAAAAATERSETAVKKSGLWRSPRVAAMEEPLRVLREALGIRASFVTAWQTDDDHLQVVVQLTSEAEGRNRLTRGPAIEDAAAVERFTAFWGADLTSTRQFSDGAIYRCVLWTFPEDEGTHTTIALSASAVLRRVVEFALRKHVAAQAEVNVLLGGLEGYLSERIGAEWRDAAPLMQRSLLDATKAVQHMLQNLPHGSVPCRIVSFDVVAASERHTEVFPARPHLALTYTTDNLQDPSFAGLSTDPTIEPIHCVLSIDDNRSIPDTMEAIAMMKGAIAAQLAKTLQAHFGEQTATATSAESGKKAKAKAKRHARGPGSEAEADGELVKGAIRTQCTSQSVDVIYRGYLFRIYIAHYREVSLLRALQRETEANVLEMKLYWTAQHAKFLKTIAFGHHSYSHAVRLAKRWMSAMCLYEFVQPEAVELLVANAYLQPANTPKTPAGGFLRFVQLLATHDWSKPLVLPFTDDDSDKTAVAAAALVRKLGDQQGMFIATPYAPAASPFTVLTPRPMIMGRLVQLAQSVVAVLLRHLEGRNATAGEVEAFTSNPAAFDFAVKFHPRLILQPDRALRMDAYAAVAGAASVGVSSSFTSSDADGRSAEEVAAAAAGSPVRIWQLDELDAATSSREYINQLVEREPAAHAVRVVRAALRERGMMFYDALAPSSLHVVGISAQRQLGKSQQLHAAVVQVARGALLPAPASAFVVESKTKGNRDLRGHDGGHDHDDEDHAHAHQHDLQRASLHQRHMSKSFKSRKAAGKTMKNLKGKGGDAGKVGRSHTYQEPPPRAGHKRPRSSDTPPSAAAAKVRKAAVTSAASDRKDRPVSKPQTTSKNAKKAAK